MTTNKTSQYANLTTDKKGYFNKKRVIGLIIWTIILIIIIGVVIRFVLNINFKQFFSTLNPSNKALGYQGIFLYGFLVFFIYCLGRFLTVWIKLRKELKNIKWYKWITFTVVSVFIQIITPFSVGSEPYGIWWLSRNGVSVRKASIIFSINSTLWTISQIIVTWPSYIAFTVTNYSAIANNTIPTIYWITLIGLVVDIFLGVLVFAFSYSRHLHIFVSTIYNKVKKILHLNFLNNEAIRAKYLENAMFKKEYKKEFKDWKLLIIFFISVGAALYNYVLFMLVYYLFNPHNSQTDWAQVFNIINIATTANNFVPVPSTEGTLQYTVRTLMNFVNASQAEVSHAIVDNSIFLWRFFNTYFGFLVGLGYIFLYGLFLGIQKIRVQKLSKVSSK